MLSNIKHGGINQFSPSLDSKVALPESRSCPIEIVRKMNIGLYLLGVSLPWRNSIVLGYKFPPIDKYNRFSLHLLLEFGLIVFSVIYIPLAFMILRPL